MSSVPSFTIKSAKGSYSSEYLSYVCAWQAEMQASFARIILDNGIEVPVDDVDFDADDLDPAIIAVEAKISNARAVYRATELESSGGYRETTRY